MRKAHRRLGLGAALILVAGGLLAMVTPTSASASPSTASACTMGTRVGHIAGIVPAVNVGTACPDPPPPPEPAFNGTPPLLFNGHPPTCFFSPCDNGDVMSTLSLDPPAGYE